MAIFGNKKEKVEKKEVSSEKASSSVKTGTDMDLSWIIRQPRITEKGADISESSNAYTFNVHKDATKVLVKKAVKDAYNVNPIKVNIVVMKRKKIERTRGRARKVGLKGGGKKAYVFLKKGDRIEFV